MNVRLKKFIGTIVLVLLVAFYALIAMSVASLYLAEYSGWVHLAYFLGSGLLWVLPAMLIIKWMETKPRSASERRRQS